MGNLRGLRKLERKGKRAVAGGKPVRRLPSHPETSGRWSKRDRFGSAGKKNVWVGRKKKVPIEHQ